MKNIKKKTKGDYLIAATRAGLGMIPLAGAATSELLHLIVTPPLEKRRIEWMTEVGERLTKLEEKLSFNLENLRENEIFIDTVLQTTQFAIRTSEKEKIQLYQNALINTALGDTPEKAEIQIFLNLIESFTIWHIKILKLFNDPKDWFEKNNKSIPSFISAGLSSILEEAYPELKNKNDFYNLIWNDLFRAGLHNSGSLQAILSSSGLTTGRTTDLGRRFLNFIENKDL